MQVIALTYVAPSQESVKTRHAQLLYESKLYKILQGGGGYSSSEEMLRIGRGLKLFSNSAQSVSPT